MNEEQGSSTAQNLNQKSISLKIPLILNWVFGSIFFLIFVITSGIGGTLLYEAISGKGISFGGTSDALNNSELVMRYTVGISLMVLSFIFYNFYYLLNWYITKRLIYSKTGDLKYATSGFWFWLRDVFTKDKKIIFMINLISIPIIILCSINVGFIIVWLVIVGGFLPILIGQLILPHVAYYLFKPFKA